MGDQGQGGQSTSSKGRENVATKTKRTTSTSSHGKVAKFWEIRNISELMEMSDEDMRENGITFDAGHSNGIPATWNFHLSNLRFGIIGGYLQLSHESAAKVVTANYSIELSCGGGTISVSEFGPCNFECDWEGRARAQPIWTKSGILDETDNGTKTLKITLRVKVLSNKAPKAPKGNLSKAEGVISDFKKMLESEDGADVEVWVPKEVGGEIDDSSYTKKVHKGILMTRSSVFNKMFAKESKMVEAKTSKVFIKDLSPKGLDIFLNYIYTGKVLKDWLQVPEEILNAAEKYDCGRLKNYCGKNLMSAVSTKNAWKMYQVAKLHKLSSAKKAIVKFISKNTKAVLDGDGDDSGDPSDSGSEEETEEEGEEEETTDEDGEFA